LETGRCPRSLRRGASGDGRTRGGLTLLEVVLVLAIITVMAGLAIVPATSAFKNEKLRRAGELVRNEFAKARIQAMESGVTYEFQYVIGGNRFQVQPRASLQDSLEMSTAAMNGDLPGTNQDVNPFAPTRQMVMQQQGQPGEPSNGPPQTGIPPRGQLVDGVRFIGGDLEVDARAQASEQAAQQTTNPTMDANGGVNGMVSGTTPLGATGTEGQWATPILFYPDGTTSNAQLILGNQRSRYVVLRLRSLTGMCRVSDLLTAEEVPR